MSKVNVNRRAIKSDLCKCSQSQVCWSSNWDAGPPGAGLRTLGLYKWETPEDNLKCHSKVSE